MECIVFLRTGLGHAVMGVTLPLEKVA